MDKKFEKKTVFMGVELSGMDQLAFTALTKQLAQHIIECHAEIIRLTEELSSLRSQAPAEREWLKKSRESECHARVEEAGIYIRMHRETERVTPLVCKAGDWLPTNLYEYTLILAEKDFPKPPKPEPEPELEVKVGKYKLGDHGFTAYVHFVKNGYCFYEAPNGEFESYPVEQLAKDLAGWKAVFIGEAE